MPRDLLAPQQAGPKDLLDSINQQDLLGNQGFGQNLVNDASDVAGGLYNSVTHLPQTVQALGGLALGEASKLGRATGMTPRNAQPIVNEDSATQLNDRISQDAQHPIRSFYNKPVSTLMDAAMVTEPFTGLAKGGLETAAEVGKAIPETIIPEAAQNLQASRLARAKELTTRFVQPPTKELANNMQNAGGENAAVNEGVNSIVKSKSHQDVLDNLSSDMNSTHSQVRDLIAQDNAPLDASYMKPVIDYKNSLEEVGSHATDAQKQAVNDVVEEENNFLNENGGIDRLGAQDRKLKLQQIADTEKLSKRNEMGTLGPYDMARQQALDKIRQGLRQAVASGPNGEAIDALNQSWGNKKELSDAVASEGAKAAKAEPSGGIFSRLRPVARGGLSGAHVNVYESLKGAPSVAKTTGQIEKLSGRSGIVSSILRKLSGAEDIAPTVEDASSVGGTQPYTSSFRKTTPTPMIEGGQARLQIEGPTYQDRIGLPAPENLYGDNFRTMTPEEQSIPSQVMSRLPAGPKMNMPSIIQPEEYSPVRPTPEDVPFRGKVSLEQTPSEFIKSKTPFQKSQQTQLLNRLLERRRLFGGQ